MKNVIKKKSFILSICLLLALASLITVKIVKNKGEDTETFAYEKYQSDIEEISKDIKYEVVKNGPRDKKRVAITFDDGPNPVYTPQILDILKEHDVKATFFVLGKHAEIYPDIVLREKNEGHEIGNHTYSHINIDKTKIDKIEEEMLRTQNIIKDITKGEVKLFRPPYGIHNEQITKMAKENNMKTVLWTYYQDTRDWSSPGTDYIVETVLSGIHNGDIILFHDHNENESHTVDALKSIIPKLKEQGYEFVTISELLLEK
ncbi:polysaccharide deacetylase [Gottschalkia acidurici 9a]|uniref:Polysaccharide deacetylase n=1 Tax=Gottschalkia acidurici (strain ATCC 7906 / DSM 604 / BCRC 14475 / CIP 104303 / KCTC 5404 / NCIMB 10678 / 9a) TaxID=1128398 RepID=K0B5P2_GOTA9|nr:polysaccharide deacetylase family protein [Gottschalkia acidurici]AFS79831.1 polysaccharide deacetylase [Gottschalkia acidurici 9a]